MVRISPELFLAASDEDNILRLYHLSLGSDPLASYDLGGFLEIDGKNSEADLEGAARMGDRVFWIGSHGLNRQGDPSPNRCRFFATDVHMQGASVRVTPIGRPCKTLVEQMLAAPGLSGLGLAESIAIKPKEEDGLNIEGLAARPDGTLLIGFRNPLPGGKALIVPLANPNEVAEGAPAKFCEPILLNLRRLGIRDMLDDGRGFMILAGPYGPGGPHRLGHWSGLAGDNVEFMDVNFRGFNPEALAWSGVSEGTELTVLSDDGSLMVGKKECKKLKPAQRSFRALVLRR